MVSSLQICNHWRFWKTDDSEKGRFPDAILMGLQHVLHGGFMSLPPKFYFSERMMSWGNIKYVLEVWGHALHGAEIPCLTSQHHSTERCSRKWGFSRKKRFFASSFSKPFVNLWSSNLESLYDIAVCDCLQQVWIILTRLSLGRKEDTLELLRHTKNSETLLLFFFFATKQTWPQPLTDHMHRPHSPSKPFSSTPQAEWLSSGGPLSWRQRRRAACCHQGVGRRLMGVRGRWKEDSMQEHPSEALKDRTRPNHWHSPLSGSL